MAVVDDLMGGSAGQPGITLTFTHPYLKDPGRIKPLAVGLSARITGTGTYVRTDRLHPTNGWFGTENVGISRKKGRINRSHAGFRTHADLGLVSQFADPDSATSADVPLVETGSIKEWESIDHSARHTSTTFMSAISVSGDASLFQLPVTLTWVVHGATRMQGEVETTIDVWQPTAMTDASSEPSSPRIRELTDQPPQPSPSISPLLGGTIQVPIAVSGVGDLQAALIEQAGADPHDIWQTLTTLRYKSNLVRILSSGEAMSIGGLPAMLQAAPIGQATILKQVTAYVAVRQEGDTSEERTVGRLSDQGAALDVKVTAFHNIGPSIIEMRGDGQETRSGTTDGVTRVFTTPNREMYLIRTAVRNVVRLSNGRTVSTEGELVLAVPKADVLAKEADLFVDPFHLLSTATEAVLPRMPEAVPPAMRHAPLSLRAGRLWGGLWLQPIGPSSLRDAVTRDARALGRDDLVVQMLPLLNGLAARLPDLDDGGQTWQLRSGGYSYEFTITARAVGESRHLESIAGAHLKLRNVSHQSQESVAVQRRRTSVGLNAGSGIHVGHEEGMEDPTSQWLAGRVTGTWLRKNNHRHGSTIGAVQGARPVDVAIFAHSLEFSYELRRRPAGLRFTAS